MNKLPRFARQRLHSAEVWKRQSRGKVSAPGGYRMRPIRVTMYRWERIRLPYVLLCRGTWTKYAG